MTVTNDVIRIKCYPKVNLGLRIYPVTNSGYHPLESIFLIAEGELHDTIEIRPSDQTSVEVLQSSIPQSDNIVFKAIQALNEDGANLPLQKIIIDKKIPIGGGLGGGSSNAGNFLRKFGSSLDNLSEIAFNLGADVPFFIQEKACMVSGFGEKLTPLNEALNIPAIIITFTQDCSTREIFQLFDTRLKKSWRFNYNKILKLLVDADPTIGNYIQNDLYDVVCDLYPKLGAKYLELAKLLSGNSFYYDMSGSGSSFFALFQGQNQRDRLFTKLIDNGFKAYQTQIKSIQS